MATTQQQFSKYSSASVSVPTTTETVAATTRTAASAYPSQPFAVQFTIELTAGTSTTGVTLKIYRGADATGTQVAATNQLAVTGGNRYVFTYGCTDQQAGDTSGQVYCITVTQTGAAANGTVQSSFSTVVVG